MGSPTPTPIALDDTFSGVLGGKLVVTTTDLFGNDVITDSNNVISGIQPISIIIDTLATNGTLKLGVANVTLGQEISYADIAAGKLTFTPTSFSTTTGSFDYSVKDNGGTSTAATASINFGVDTLTASAPAFDGVSNASQYQYVYTVDFDTTSGLTTNGALLNLSNPTTITDNDLGTGIGAVVVANPGAASGGPTSSNDSLEYTSEFMGLAPGSGLATYLANLPDIVNGSGTYGSGNWIINYAGWELDGEPVISVYNRLEQVNSYMLLSNSNTLPTGVASQLGTATNAVYSYTICFEKNTFISTPSGEKLVSTLAIGDEVLTADNRKVKVQWIGLQTVNSYFAKLNGNMPVKICAGALGDGIPTSDLLVSPNHAMFVEGVLVHALALVNGTTITQMQRWTGDIEYFHIETENHELILANGAAAETFIDNVSRKEFDNWAEYESLYPNAAPMVELDLPRVKFARQLPKAISDRLNAVAKFIESPKAIAA
jgi:hypothetical protein